MPVVARYGPRKVDTAPLPGARKTASETPLSEGAGIEQARAQKFAAVAQLGAQLGQVGDTLEGAHQKAVAEADATALVSARRQLDEAELALLDDPEHGALHQRGNDALALPETVRAAFDQRAAAIGASLRTPRQQQLFADARAAKWVDVQSRLLPYVATQIDAVHDQEASEAVQASLALAVANAGDHVRFAAEIDKAAAVLQLQGQRRGQSAELTQAQIDGMQSMGLDGAIRKLVADGRPTAAQLWLDEGRDRIRGDRLGALEEVVKTATLNQRADGAALRILARTVDDQVALDAVKQIDDNALQDAVRTRVKEGLAQRATAQRDAHQQALLNAANLVEQTRSIRAIPPEDWRTFTLSERKEFMSYSESLSAGVAPKTDPELYEQLTDRATSSDPAVRQAFAASSLVPFKARLSPSAWEHFEALRAEIRKGDAQGKVIAATMDTDQFNALASAAGLRVYGGLTVTAADRARVGQLRERVEAEIDRQQGAKGRPLTRDEKGSVMRELVDQHVLLDVWGTDPSVPLGAVTPAERSRAYVPIADVPTVSREEFANIVRAHAPRSLRLSTDEIVGRYRDRFQRAYAALLMHLPDDAITAILTGADQAAGGQ
jgi:hypothetical protein